MTFSIYARLFTEHQIIRTAEVYKKSRYLPFPMKNAFLRLSSFTGCIKSSDYILGPIYDDNTFQIGVTGTVEEKEEFEHAIVRELGEEIGVIPEKITYFKTYEWRRFDKPDTKFSVYYSNIGDCLPVQFDKHGVNLSSNNDRTDQKVGCFVFGHIENMKSFLNQQAIYFYGSEDHIIGVCAVNVGELRASLIL